MFIPCAPAGEWACAASPARNRRPQRYVEAIRCCSRTWDDQPTALTVPRKARVVKQISEFLIRDNETGLPARVGGIRLAGGHDPPGRAFRDRESEQQPVPSWHHMDDVLCEVGVEFYVGEHDLMGVPGAEPRNAGEAADGAAGSVAAHQVAIPDLLGDSFPSNRRLGRRSRRADTDEFGAAFHLNTALGQSTAENRFDVGLPDEQQMRKGRVGKIEVGEWHQDVAVSQVQLG